MRIEFAQSVIALKAQFPKLLFLTGDLGYLALEKVEQQFGAHFINAGVAEQNMVTVAAGLAYEGFVPLCYSISPFVTLRPYEQLRNDVCLHNLPVKIVGNGGGYGYGIMGATHHNIEDIGAMRLLPNMRVYVPFTAEDVLPALTQILREKNPNYLRLNLGAKVPFTVPAFAAWRKIKDGNRAVAIGTGPVLEHICNLPTEITEGLEIWVNSIFPISPIPNQLIEKISATQNLLTIEEHQGECGMHEALASQLMQRGVGLSNFLPLYAKGYPSGKYGDQLFHLQENGLAGQSLLQKVRTFLAGSVQSSVSGFCKIII